MYEILKVEFSKKENNSHIKELMSYDKHKNYYIYRIINFLYTDNIKKIIKEKSFDIRLFSIDNGYSDNTKLKIEYKIDINKLKIISDILMINFKDIINSDCTEFVNFYIGNLNIDHKQVEKIKKNGYGEVENIVKIQKNNN